MKEINHDEKKKLQRYLNNMIKILDDMLEINKGDLK